MKFLFMLQNIEDEENAAASKDTCLRTIKNIEDETFPSHLLELLYVI